MGLYLGHAPCWMVAPFWEVLVNLPSRQSWATPVGCCLPHPGWLFMPSGHSWLCWTGVFPQPVLFWKHCHSASFPFHPARQTSFSIPLSCCSSLGSEPFGGLEYHQGGGCTAWAPAPRAAPWCGMSHVRWLLWLEHLLTSPWVWALILAWNFILTELIPDCFRLQKLVSDKAVFNKDIRGKELCWLDRALPCWALLWQMRKRRSPPSTLPSCSLAVWWSRRRSGGGGWYLFLPDKKIATKYLYTVGCKQHTEPE